MLTSTKKIICIVLALTVIIYLGFGYFLYRLHRLDASGIALSSDVLTLATKEKDTEKLKTTINDTREKAAALDSYFVSHDSVAKFLEAMEHLGTLAGTTFAITTVEEKPNEKNTVLAISAHATGSFQQIFNLISLLEAAPYEIHFESVDISAGTASPDATLPGADAKLWDARLSFTLLTFTK